MANLLQQRTAPGPRTLPAIRLEHLWVLLSLTITGIFISLTPTSPNDFWWHLKAGELIASDGIPTTNMFAWTLPADTPFIYQSWLAEWLFYALTRLGGLPLAIFARNLLAITTLTLVGYETRRRSGSWRLAAAAVLFAGAMILNNLTTRTQNWAWLPFALYLVILGAYVDGQLKPGWLFVLPALMFVWVNVHGSFTLGPLLVGTFAAGESLRRLLRQPRALSWERLRWLYLALAAVFAATMVNPLGPGVFGYVSRLLGDVPIQTLINEWQPPTPRTLAGAFFYLGVLALLAAFAFARRRPSITDVLLVCGLAWQAFGGARFVVWFALAAMPIAAQSLVAPRPVLASVAPRISGRERGGGGPANMIAAALLVGMLVAVQPWFKPLLPLPDEYQALFVDLPGAPQLFSADTPVAATEHLRTSPCEGRLFNELGYGSYLAWALYPAAQHFIDPRIELFPKILWDDYVNLTRGRDVAETLERHNIACVMLDRGHQPALAETMAQLPGWQRSFNDERSEVWRR